MLEMYLLALVNPFPCVETRQAAWLELPGYGWNLGV